ncbi:MAG TPA: efflux RND transporter periplasmic adaptor subunit [Phenylobacterium sp.]|jgi:HlyD family secretion protein|nr:efflux RND transporter periplasmic adaptor subunit [Phenylobacterium sp.]
MRLRPLILSLAATLALAACSAPPAPKSADVEQARAIRVVRIEPRNVQGSLAATGDLVPYQDAAVLPEVNGYRVSRVLADVGQWVKKGQVLAQLDPSLIQAQVAQQQALLAQAQAQAAQAADQANRVKGLDNAGVLSQEQIDQRRFQARAAQATANAQAAALRDLRSRYAKLSVTAPVAGLVLEKTVRPGDLSAVSTTPWFRLARDGEIELQAQLSEADLAKIHPGQAVSVTLPDGVVVNGQVRLVSPEVDTQTKLGYVRVRLPVRSDVRAGGFARAVFTEASGAVPAVPDTAVSYDADGAAVMVVEPNNRLRRVLVETGQRGGGWVQLVKGPAAGTRVVRSAGGLLLEGDLIRPIEDDPPPASAAAAVVARR